MEISNLIPPPSLNINVSRSILNVVINVLSEIWFSLVFFKCFLFSYMYILMYAFHNLTISVRWYQWFSTLQIMLKMKFSGKHSAIIQTLLLFLNKLYPGPFIVSGFYRGSGLYHLFSVLSQLVKLTPSVWFII